MAIKKTPPEETMAGCGHFSDIYAAPMCGDCAKALFCSMKGHEKLLAILLRQAQDYHSQPITRSGEDLFHLNISSAMGETAAHFFRSAVSKLRKAP